MRRLGDRLVRLADDQRILTAEECEAIARRVIGFAQGEGETRVELLSWWQGELRWARNRVSLATDRRTVQLRVLRGPRGRSADMGGGLATTNQLDDISLESVVRAAERNGRLQRERSGAWAPGLSFTPPYPEMTYPPTAIWSDATYSFTGERRGEVARAMVEDAEARGMLSAGYLEARAAQLAEYTSEREPIVEVRPYVKWTQAQCSTTVRDSRGAGSGWAGLSSYDWAKIDAHALAALALEKCKASQNPLALEPGRYTVILEPQAVADLVEILVPSFSAFSRKAAELVGQGPFVLGFDDALKLWRSKLGLKVADERVTISHEPVDSELGILPTANMQPLKWIDRGVLTALDHDRDYALKTLNENAARRSLTGYRMSGGESSVEEMVRTTKRGLLVTRFSNIRRLDDSSLVSTGLTRDGLWLIENGKITKAVKNFRFTESPLFVLNSIEQLGVPVPVFRPTRGEGKELTPAIVPALKVRDFSFTSTIDAI
ncbi:MAG TPA: metallopeptidase TldD-related protein [Gemmatimonadaceae bacterium]